MTGSQYLAEWPGIGWAVGDFIECLIFQINRSSSEFPAVFCLSCDQRTDEMEQDLL